MTLHEQSHPDATEASTDRRPRIVDRRDEPIGLQAEPATDLASGPIEVELAEETKHVLGVDDDRVAVPAEWVAGVRRDEIRLSLSLEDPAFRSRLFEARPRPEG